MPEVMPSPTQVIHTVYRNRCVTDAYVSQDLALIHKLRHHRPTYAYNQAMDRLRADCAVESSRITAAMDDAR